MTDKKTDYTDKGFDLNHFGQTRESESFDTANLFTEAEQAEQSAAGENIEPIDTTGRTGQFAELGDGKKEPSIPQKDEPDTDKEVEQPGIIPPAPPLAAEASSAQPADQRSGTKPITVFAILAMLVAAIAVWLNPGATNDNHEDSPLEPRPVLAADVQIQRLETRIASLGQSSKQQREELNQQIEHLQQQVSRLTGLLAKQSRKQQTTKHAKAPAKSSSSSRRPSTAALSSSTNAGWVVNLASVDSKHAARKSLNRYKNQGIPVEIFAAVVKGKTWYRLRIGGFASKQEAMAQKKYLATKHGIKDAWIQKP